MFNVERNLNDKTEKEILDMVHDTDPNLIFNKNQRLNLIKMLYKIFGYNLSPDLLYMLLTENQSQLVLATAGGGKTTNAQVKLVEAKMVKKSRITGGPLRGDKMLCLVYNKHNVEPMQEKHKELVGKLYASGIQGINIDSEIVTRTMHSFCEEWKNMFLKESGLMNFTVMTEYNATNLMTATLNGLSRKHSKEFKESIPNLLKIYALVRESLLDYYEMDKLGQFKDLKLPKEIVIELYQAYDRMKKIRKWYDFTDQLCAVYRLLKEEGRPREFMINYYDYILADEVQDFNPVMMEILKLLSNGTTPLICIGDEDQTIYSFRGADIYNLLKFEEYFVDPKILSLAYNRRCRRNILDASKRVIEHNTLRFNKDIECVKEGGTVEYIPYNTREGQIIKIINRLENMSQSEVEDTVICYRDKLSSLLLTQQLEKRDIPFNVLSGYQVFSHELYKHIDDVMNVIYRPYDRFSLLNLYKILPLTKSEVYKVLGYNEAKDEFISSDPVIRFDEYDWGQHMSKASFVSPLADLVKLTDIVVTEPLNKYFKYVFEMFRKYFWNYKKSLNDNEEVDTYFESVIMNEYMQPTQFKYLEMSLEKRKTICKDWSTNRMGVTVGTYHSLKGDEYKNVIMIDLEDDMFPNYELIDAQVSDEEARIQTKESEVRLCYVAMTRAIDTLQMYYKESNPSLYIKWLLNEPMRNSTVETTKLDLFTSDSQISVSQTSQLTTLQLQDVKEVSVTQDSHTELTLEDTEDDIGLTLELDISDLDISLEPEQTENKIKFNEPQIVELEPVADEVILKEKSSPSEPTPSESQNDDDNSSSINFSSSSFLTSVLDRLQT